eukprot:CAMPEP_0197596066 /NCGR_PEP_ID=MMETSP1326-20131121/24285_1 /TAXON_ID=1155430 /ORGANISM="Genus nov. species nov., Strain RCC2288" /LENGTH=175 /DNA_ID=CAMNT_0043162507 /DNA_START=48 /DNA_END=575 /DNA_ORIENTATION=+
MAALCAAPAFAVAARRTAVVTRATSDAPKAATAATPNLNRRNVLLSVPAFLAASSAAGSASAKAPPTYYDDTIEVIGLTKSIISGADLSPANIAKFQEKRDIWYANYQLRHEKGVGYGYANTFNAQAKLGFQIRVFEEKGEPFDPNRTAYNKDYLLKILQVGQDSLDEMKLNGSL